MVGTPRRILKSTAASLAIGVTVTLLLSGPASIVIAWLAPSYGRVTGGSILNGHFGFGTAWSVHRTRWLFQDRWHVGYMELSIPGIPEPVLKDEPPRWVLRPSQLDRDRHINSNPVTTIAAGWPFRAFSSVEWLAVIRKPGDRHAHIGYEYDNGWCVRPAKGMDRIPALVIPTRPIWAGLLANVALWSSAAAMVVAALTTGRAALRRRRNLCSACAYSRAGIAFATPCPECGSAPR